MLVFSLSKSSLHSRSTLAYAHNRIVFYLTLGVPGDGLGLEPEVDDLEVIRQHRLLGPLRPARGLRALQQRVLARLVGHLQGVTMEKP